MQIEETIEKSMLMKISNSLSRAQNDTENSELGLSGTFQRISEHFVKIVIFVAIAATAVWIGLIAGDVVDVSKEYCKYCFPFERGISVLVSSCPCALGLAIPSVIVVALNLAMKQSILIKSNDVFEKGNRVNAVIFDKTGTLFTKVVGVSEVEIVSEKISNMKKIQ